MGTLTAAHSIVRKRRKPESKAKNSFTDFIYLQCKKFYSGYPGTLVGQIACNFWLVNWRLKWLQSW